MRLKKSVSLYLWSGSIFPQLRIIFAIFNYALFFIFRKNLILFATIFFFFFHTVEKFLYHSRVYWQFLFSYSSERSWYLHMAFFKPFYFYLFIHLFIHLIISNNTFIYIRKKYYIKKLTVKNIFASFFVYLMCLKK